MTQLMAETSRPATLRRRGLALVAGVLLAAGAVTVGIDPVVSAQQQAPSLTAAQQRIPLTAGRSTVLTTEFDVFRIAIPNPEVADAVVVSPREVLIDGKSAGTVSLIVWGNGVRAQYDIVVEPGVSVLEQRLRSLYPGEDIRVSANDEAIILSGRVSSNTIALRAAEIAGATSAEARVVNLLELPGASESQQVLLQVRFAEVSRRALTEFGISIFTAPFGVENTIFRTTTQQFAAPGYGSLNWTKSSSDFGSPVTSSSGEITFGDFLNLFIFSQRYDIGAMIRALSNKGLFQSLAEPNLIAYNGQEAGFLAGGEIPVPVVQGGNNNAVSIAYKEYGIRLNFRPTIAGDTIRLRVRPEVSTLDYANGILLSGFRIPALSTRRAETEVELRDGQSFAIAGLLNNVSQDDVSQIPGLGSIPIIGYLFKSKANRMERNELMVLITPRLVRPLNPDEVPPLPTLQQRFLPDEQALGSELNGGGGVVDSPAPPAPRP
jgi:pilus assembly protein CpaC